MTSLLPPPARSLERTVVLLWRNLGPYHLARGRAVAQRAEGTGWRVVLIQIGATEATRDWCTPTDMDAFEVRTLAPGEQIGAGSPSFHRELRVALGELRPAVVAVAGYDRREMREALAWGEAHGSRVVLMSETKWDDRRHRPFWRTAFIRRQVRRAGAALVSGGAASEYAVLLGVPREKVFRPYGVVDNGVFARAATDDDVRRGTPYFLASLRLIETRKNVLRLLEAHRRYQSRERGSAWDLVVCGDGPDRARYETWLEENAADGIRFVGFQQLPDLARWYGGASCFVHPATQEAWGLVVNEAMAAGLPVLVSRRCGCASDLVVEGVNGYTFDPLNVPELSELMRTIARLPASARAEMGRAGQRRIGAWSPSRFADGLLRAARAARSIEEG